MKKLSILIIALLVVAGFGFAEESAWGEFDVDIEASATFGWDIDQNVSGIRNSTSVDLEWIIYDDTTLENEAMGDVWGWIEVDDLEIAVDADDASGNIDVDIDSIEAQLNIGPAYISITDTELDVDSATEVVDIAEIEMEDDDYDSLLDISTAAWDPSPEFAGVTLGADLGVIAFDLSIASEYDWSTEGGTNGRNTNGAWYYGLDATIAPIDALEIGIEAAMSQKLQGNPGLVAEGNAAGVGASATYELAVGDLTVAPNFGVDVLFVNGQDLGGSDEIYNFFEIGAGVTALDEDDNGVGLGVVYTSLQSNDDGDRLNGLLFVLEAAEEDEEGLVPVLGAQLILEYAIALANEDLLVDDNETSFAIGTFLNAALGVAEPYFGVVSGTTLLADANGATAIDLAATIKAGVDLDLVPNTTFTIEWLSGDILADPDVVVTGYAEDEFVLASGIDGGTTGDVFGTLAITTTIALD